MSIIDQIARFCRSIFPTSWFRYPQLRWDVNELIRRLNPAALESILQRRKWWRCPKWNKLGPYVIPYSYWWHKIPKKNGGMRCLRSPNPRLKQLQKLLLRRVFSKIEVHPAAKGFRRGESAVTHATLHVAQAVIVHIDIKDFFHKTKGERLYSYFRMIGWNYEAARLMMFMCTHRNCLPQGTPTSPILSNLVNYRMDARLAGLAARSKAVYSRYADDIIFSFDVDNRRFIRGVIRRVVKILNDFDYQMNRAKLRIMRQHNRQVITGLVVNEKVHLPRKTRRWLRAVEHHMKTGKAATLTQEQLQGWKAYQQMIDQQNK